MKRNLICCLAACLLGLPATAAAQPASVTGEVSAVGSWSITVQTPGKAAGVVDALTRAADRVTSGDYPYVYGGGHGQAGIASVGIKGPGYNGKRIGFDCSGSVAAVLAGAGLWPTGGGVPSDSGIISELLARHLISPGAGTGAVEVTLYDDPGVHIFMNVDGRFFGTSDGGGGGNRKGGAGWLDDGAPDATSRTYKRYHVVPWALRQSTDAGHSVTLQAGALRDAVAGVQMGDKVRISYRQTRAGTLTATAIVYPGMITTTGVVGTVAPDGSTFTIQASGAVTLTLNAGGLSQLVQQLAVGDTVQVGYTKDHSGLTVRALTVTASAAPAQATVPATSGYGDGPTDGGQGWQGGGS